MKKSARTIQVLSVKNIIKVAMVYTSVFVVFKGSSLFAKDHELDISQPSTVNKCEMHKTLREVMTDLRRDSKSALFMPDAWIKEQTPPTEQQIDTVLASFKKINSILSCVTEKSPEAEDTLLGDEGKKFHAAYLKRVELIGGLFRVLEQELIKQRSISSERDFRRAQKISVTIRQCRDKAHDDFMQATSEDNMQPASCVFIE